VHLEGVRVRTFRTLVGLVLSLVGFLALLAGLAGALALSHRDSNGGRTATLAALHATLTVTTFPGWLEPATAGLLVLGVGALLFGVALLFMASEPVLVVEAHRVVEFADRVAERLEEIAPGESLAVVRRTRGLDLTGELVTLRPEAANTGAHHTVAPPGHNARRWRSRGHTPPELTDRWAVDADAEADSTDDGESPYVYTAT
jgi:hypothetical protein